MWPSANNKFEAGWEAAQNTTGQSWSGCLCSEPWRITRDPGTSLSLGSLAAFPTTSPGLEEDTTSSSRFCFPYIPRHQPRRHYRCQATRKAGKIPPFLSLRCVWAAAGRWACGGHLAPQEITQLQPPRQGQLLGAANQVARGCKILPSNLSYTLFAALLQNTKSK